ncbi:pantoate--beta-alanine ligase, partial [Algoriphagus sp. A40]|uniref:pantoate--beta-alanine ligase n=1 Tax=Algoriphagus sp. A40 TaxID=1945863 RepID=UPI0009848F5D
MKLIRTGAEWNPLWLNHLQKKQQIGLVPTMGALHDGHLDLVIKSKATADLTVVSIFVNPTQFNNPEDFAKYPITLEADLQKLADERVDYVFLPSVETMYPAPTRLRFDFGDLERKLEGKFRPGHFNGVGVVVSKLFHLIRPQVAFFGQKDLQQVGIIKRLVNDLSFELKLEIVPTRREPDGLAMSSRNMRLSPIERKKAILLFTSLEKAKTELFAGKNWLEIQTQIKADFGNEPFANLEYFELVNPETFESYSQFDRYQKSFICVASYIGDTRLIDN